MIIKKITRERLYKREYDKDKIIEITNVNQGDYVINTLVPVIALSLKGGEKYGA